MSELAWQACVALAVIFGVCGLAAAVVAWVSRHDLEAMDENDRACRDE